MRHVCYAAATLLLGFLASVPCFGWGSDGHKIIAEIAWQEMTPEARAAVEKLLADDPDCHTIQEASVRADEVRREPEYAWTAPLHYVNLPPGSESLDMGRDCPDGNCVVGAIERFAKVLRDKQASQAERREAFKFLVHFVGDLHRPLHVSHVKDRGGRGLHVRFTSSLDHSWPNWVSAKEEKPAHRAMSPRRAGT